MKIGIDARLWSESGVGRYIRNLIFNLAQIDTKNEYFIFLLKKNLGQKLPQNFQEIPTDIPWYGLREQILLPKILNKHHLDLVHFPHFNVPIFYQGRFVVTIHDLIHQQFDRDRSSRHGPVIYKFKKIGYNIGFKNALSRSQKILTVSDFVKRDLIKTYQINPEKIVITKEAAEEKIIKLAKEIKQQDIQKVLAKFKITGRFLYYIGNAHPHKNIEGLIKAFLVLKKTYPDLRLVLSGQNNWFWQKIKQENEFEEIIYTGFVTDLESVALRKAASIYVQPSFAEGFGIPLLEAFACSCPVVSANVASLPEVAGDAALYFDPFDLQDMEKKISYLLNNPKQANELVKKGEKRYKEFSWKQLAEKTWNIYTTGR